MLDTVITVLSIIGAIASSIGAITTFIYTRSKSIEEYKSNRQNRKDS